MKSFREIIIEKHGKLPQHGDNLIPLITKIFDSLLEYTDKLEERVCDIEASITWMMEHDE